MKHFFLSFFLLLTVGLAFGQPTQTRAPNLPNFDDKALNFGFLIGFNAMDYRVVSKAPGLQGPGGPRYADVVSLSPGINIGMVTSFRLNKYFNFRVLPGISFGQRDLLFVSENGEEDEFPLEIKSTYIECPLVIKFNGGRMTNAKPFLTAGINPRFDLAKSKKDGLMVRPFDVFWEIGAGMDSYMSYFRFSTELKLSVGLMNVLNPQGTGEPEDVLYSDVLDRLTSRIFVLTFYFE
ncbi:porin family protein [Geofilum rubicundum]|uniref:PorT protein n=1 Tax=Geofilum rubicundum JCM 15548 TaxID=1236989 RepID=A0A0E9LW81_9BACT|nr:porin family protein [Geofilum rubicundum]GAO29563.1 PorT protein [Geofilum rubicundum JCM 15548]